MQFSKNIYLSFFAMGAITLAFAFNNCTGREGGFDQQSTSLASTGCKVEPDVLVSQIKDGDYHIDVLVPQIESINFSEKVYLNNSTDPARAPRWKPNVVNWYYNPSGAPSSIAATALSTIQQSMAYWTSVCNINFVYMGETTKASTSTAKDGTNVIGWGNAGGATGITYSSMRGSTIPVSITESDINLSTTDIRDTTTLRAVANHELGHLIGLAHSDVSASIMFANPYHDVQYLLTLRADDISGCVEVYGMPGSSPTPTPAPSSTPPPSSSTGPTPVPTTGSAGQGC